MKRLALIVPLLAVAMLCMGVGAYFYQPLSTGFYLTGGTSSTGTLSYTSAGTATLSGTGTFNLTNFITSGSNVTFGTATVSALNIGSTQVINSSTQANFNSVATTGVNTFNLTATNSVTFTGLSGSTQNDIMEIDGSDGGNSGAVSYTSIAGLAGQLGVSDYRIKQNIAAISGNAAAVINALVPVTFNYTGNGLNGKPNGFDAAKPHTGFIAQSVSSAIANAGTQTSDGTNGYEDRAVIAWLVLNQQQMTATISQLTASLSQK